MMYKGYLKFILPPPILLAVVFFIVGKSSGAVMLDRVVATVNDDVITWSELRKVIELDGREHLQGLAGEKREKKIEELEKFFLNRLINIRLQLQEAQRLRLTVSAAETDSAVNDIKRKYNLTKEELMESLEKEGLTLQKYRTRLSEQILLSKVVNYDVKSKVFVSDKAIDDYYKANMERYQKQGKVRIRQIFFPVPEHDSMKVGVEKKAEEIIQRLKEGEEFAKLADEYSEDSGRGSGGDLGYIKRGSLLKEVEETAFTLKPGEASGPFWSSAGLHIIKVEDRIKGSSVEDVRREIKDTLFDDAFRLKLDKWIKELRETAYIEINL